MCFIDANKSKNMSIQSLFGGIKLIRKDTPDLDLILKMQEIINKDGIDPTIHNVKPYISTTENQRYLNMTINEKTKRAFIILGAGDTLFELLSRGIKDITAADINELQILVAKLRIACLKTLSAKDFDAFLIDEESKRFLSKEVFADVQEALKDDPVAFNVWNTIFNMNPTEDIRNHLFKKVSDANGTTATLRYGIPYLKNRSAYYLARDNMESANISFVNADAIEYLSSNETKVFDYIDLTNILLFVFQMQCFNDKNELLKCIAKLKKIFDTNLNNGGVFVMDYQFETDISQYSESLSRFKAANNSFGYATTILYQTIFELLSSMFVLEKATVERIIHGTFIPYDTILYTRKR